MGRKGVLTSAAAGGSLIAASLLLVVAVSAMIGFHGFRSASEVPARQSVVINAAKAEDREAGATPAPVVIGSGSSPGAARTPARAQRSVRRAIRRARARSAPPARGVLFSPARKNRPAPAAAGQRAAPAPVQAPATQPAQKAPAASPVGSVVDDVTGAVEDAATKPVESIGDLLLDLRDVLP